MLINNKTSRNCLLPRNMRCLINDQLGRSLRFCHLEFNNEVIFDVFLSHFRVFKGGGGGWGVVISPLFLDLGWELGIFFFF